jgi:hypothetical protein
MKLSQFEGAGPPVESQIQVLKMPEPANFSYLFWVSHKKAVIILPMGF